MRKKALSALGRPVRRVEARADAPPPPRAWPFTIAAVTQLLREGLDLGPATVLVGENGTGKSTLVEALAVAYGLNAEGGSPFARSVTRAEESPLADHLHLVRGIGAKRWGYFLRAETMHGHFSYLEQNPGTTAETSYHRRSHGESFLDLVTEKFLDRDGRPQPGLYVLDEPESALSFTSSLALVGVLKDLMGDPGVQIVMATHSPVLSALPGATILELGPHGYTPTPWEDLSLVVNERAFLNDPTRQLRLL